MPESDKLIVRVVVGPQPSWQLAPIPTCQTAECAKRSTHRLTSPGGAVVSFFCKKHGDDMAARYNKDLDRFG